MRRIICIQEQALQPVPNKTTETFWTIMSNHLMLINLRNVQAIIAEKHIPPSTTQNTKCEERLCQLLDDTAIEDEPEHQ